MTVDLDRLYWTSVTTSFIHSINKYSGLEVESHVARNTNNILAFGDNLQPYPGKHDASSEIYYYHVLFLSFRNDVFLDVNL